MMVGTTSTNLLCGLSGYSGFGTNYGSYYGGYGYNTSSADVSNYQNNAANNYTIWQTQSGYNNKSAVETETLNQQCANIQNLLVNGRSDEASEQIEVLVNDLKNYAQYSGYSDKEVRAVARQMYQNATGSDMLTDTEENASGSFIQGLKEGLPLGSIFANKSTKDDLNEQITGIEKTKGATLSEVAGSAASGAASYAAIGAGIAAACSGGIGAGVGAAIGGVIGGIVGIVKACIPSVQKS